MRDDPSDDELLRATAAGDRWAFEQYYRRNAPWLEIRLRRRCGDPEVAADILQEVFLAVWRAAASSAVWFGGLAATVLALVAARRRWLAFLPATVAVAGAAWLLNLPPDHGWERDFAATELAGAAVAVPLALTKLSEPRLYGAFELVRNTAAAVGAVALSTAVAGARLAWLPVAPYVLVVMSVGPRNPGTAWWTWPVQPWASPLAVWSAAVLLILGGAAYGWSGAGPGGRRG